MASQYPAAIYTPRTMVNRPGTVYDAAQTKRIYAEDFNKDREEIVAIENTLGLNPEGAETDVAARLAAIEAMFTPEDWIDVSFENSWANYDNTWEHAQYFKDPFGVVHLKGCIKSGTLGVTAFTLPVGYRPAGYFTVAAVVLGGSIGYYNIYSTGQIVPINGNNSFFGLSSISFKAA